MLNRILSGSCEVVPLFESEVYSIIKASFPGFSPVNLSEVHKLFTMEQIAKANKRANEEINAKSLRILKQLVRHNLGYKGKAFINATAVVRYITPFDFQNEQKDALKGHGKGKVAGLAPHRDSWYNAATNTVNIWMALTDVQMGGSLIVYPDVWQKPLKHDGVKIAKDQPVGKLQTFDVPAGSALLFCSDHLHASELNVLDRTRIVVTFRFVPEEPKFANIEGKRPRYINADHLGTPLEFWTSRPRVFSAWGCRKLWGKIWKKL